MLKFACCSLSPSLWVCVCIGAAKLVDGVLLVPLFFTSLVLLFVVMVSCEMGGANKKEGLQETGKKESGGNGFEEIKTCAG